MMWFLKVSALFQNLKSPGFGKVAHADNTALLQKVEEGYNYALLLRSDHWQKVNGSSRQLLHRPAQYNFLELQPCAGPPPDELAIVS
ncbi:unnamed protein product, partial [Ceratitis capitata]